VPAAAVIPAPIAYIKVVAVKKLVVEFLSGFRRIRLWCDASTAPSSRGRQSAFTGIVRTRVLYCEKIRVFKAGLALEYISME
jgi:hypothetical protein